jgi:hypothetical protein
MQFKKKDLSSLILFSGFFLNLQGFGKDSFHREYFIASTMCQRFKNFVEKKRWLIKGVP